ncbi:MAG: Gfo/Idh/MocA family oxidoreductase [Acidobacteriota bacterium]
MPPQPDATPRQLANNRLALCTTDYRELLQREDLNTILIMTRHDTHARLTALCRARKQTVFVEKPLALSETELQDVAAAVAQTNGRVLVGFNRRFSSLSAELKEFFRNMESLAVTYRVNAGEILKESWIQQAEGGGRVLGEVCHFVDYLQFLTDAEPVEVFAYQSAAGADTLTVILKMSDGSVGNINYLAQGDRAFPKERVEVYGGGRVAVLDDFRALEMWRAGKRKQSKRLTQDKGFDQELAAFVAAIRQGNEMPIAWRSLLLTTLTTLRINDALSTGQPQAIHWPDDASPR